MRCLLASSLVVVMAIGCADNAPNIAATPIPERALEYDTTFMLDRLRETVSESSEAKWSLALSPGTWSTCTVDLGNDRFTAETAAVIWSQWTQPITALTLKSRARIKAGIGIAIDGASSGGRTTEHEFDACGFRFFVTASNRGYAGTNFVRISFMDRGIARLIDAES